MRSSASRHAVVNAHARSSLGCCLRAPKHPPPAPEPITSAMSSAVGLRPRLTRLARMRGISAHSCTAALRPALPCPSNTHASVLPPSPPKASLMHAWSWHSLSTLFSSTGSGSNPGSMVSSKVYGSSEDMWALPGATPSYRTPCRRPLNLMKSESMTPSVTSLVKSALESWKSSHGWDARTLAARGASFIRACSPTKLPGPTVVSTSPVAPAYTSMAPVSTTYMPSASSPSSKRTSPFAASRRFSSRTTASSVSLPSSDPLRPWKRLARPRRSTSRAALSAGWRCSRPSHTSELSRYTVDALVATTPSLCGEPNISVVSPKESPGRSHRTTVLSPPPFPPFPAASGAAPAAATRDLRRWRSPAFCRSLSSTSSTAGTAAWE
mmetsp:Transcript_9672/g.33716  ORF Transcript_9672/g.33716 Transcript_9672/m.33716 type:complete len:381 (+) Transcript_9672:537-1679(+)